MASLSARSIQLLLVVCWCIQVAETCIHDSLDHKFIVGIQNYHDSHPFIDRLRKRRLRDNNVSEDTTTNAASGTRKLTSTAFQPIRMTPYYDNSSLSNLPDATRAVVFEVVGEAIQRIRRALQVVPVSGNLFAERFCTATFSTIPPVCHSIAENELCLEMPMPDDHFASTKYCDSCSKSGCNNCKMSPAGAGVPNTDFLIYVRAESSSNCQSGSTLAYASTCQQDQYDRPTFGMVNFCPDQLSTTTEDFERQVSTALHEFSHALGFSSRFFPLMRNEDGTPRTPRNLGGNPPTYTSGTCPNGKQIDYYVEPSNTTIKYSTERNHVVAKMVTPRVRAFVRDHFNCSTLEGAEIESQDGGCIGSHWEERLFEPEFMTPVDSYHNVFSALTLAFFADSGWYQVNASTSEVMHFGRKKGCSFATEKCVDPATQSPIAEHFCTSNTAQGCSADARSRSTCSLSSTSQSIPSEYQYFPSSPTKGGLNAFADFCPMNVGFTAGDCSISSNRLKLGSTSINAYGETYCPTCRCTATSLRSADSTGWGINPARQSGCYAMRCIAGIDSSTKNPITVVELTIPRSKTNDAVAVNCTRKGEKLAVSGFSGDITCPDPQVVCEYDDPSRILLAISGASPDTSSGSHNTTASSAPATSNASRDAGSKNSLENSQSYSKDSAPSGAGNDASNVDSSNSRTDSGSTSKSGSTSITTGRIASGAVMHQWASCIVLGGTWFALVIIL